jgi:hypothetical protein
LNSSIAGRKQRRPYQVGGRDNGSGGRPLGLPCGTWIAQTCCFSDEIHRTARRRESALKGRSTLRAGSAANRWNCGDDKPRLHIYGVAGADATCGGSTTSYTPANYLGGTSESLLLDRSPERDRGFWSRQILPFLDPVWLNGYLDFETAVYRSLAAKTS